jgi:hypothetical protein
VGFARHVDAKNWHAQRHEIPARSLPVTGTLLYRSARVARQYAGMMPIALLG